MLLRGSSHLGKKDFSKFALLPPFWGPNPQKFVSKMGKILHYSSPLSTTRRQKAEIWQECCLGGHLTWVKRIFRNSHFYPLFGGRNPQNLLQKCGFIMQIIISQQVRYSSGQFDQCLIAYFCYSTALVIIHVNNNDMHD